MAVHEANVIAATAAPAGLFGACASGTLTSIMHNRLAAPSTPRRRGIVLRAAAPLFVLAAAAACARAEAQPAAPPPPKVTVATVVEQTVTEWDEFTGRLEAVDTVAVRPRVSGYVSK